MTPRLSNPHSLTHSLTYSLTHSGDKSLVSGANQYVDVWRGKDRVALVKEEYYAALVRVRRLLPDNDAVSARLSPVRCTYALAMHIAFIS